MKKNPGGTQKNGGGHARLGSPASAPDFAYARPGPRDIQLKRPVSGAPRSGQTSRPAQPGIAPGHAHRQAGRRGDTGGGAKE